MLRSTLILKQKNSCKEWSSAWLHKNKWSKFRSESTSHRSYMRKRVVVVVVVPKYVFVAATFVLNNSPVHTHVNENYKITCYYVKCHTEWIVQKTLRYKQCHTIQIFLKVEPTGKDEGCRSQRVTYFSSCSTLPWSLLLFFYVSDT